MTTRIDGMPRKVQRECPACGTTYEADETRLRHGRQTTCSRTCSYRLRGNQLEKRSTVHCAICEKELSRTPKQIKAKHGVHYCSRACHYRGRTLGLTPRVVAKPYVLVAPPRSPEAIARQVATRRANDGYQHSDDTRARLRETTARAIAEGRIPSVSKLEDVVAKELDALGVGYRRQVAMRGARGRYVASVDFLLDDGRVLEVNGTFWHADPRAYPEGPVHPAQVRTAERWSRKVAALANQDIAVVEVWEMDLRKDVAEAVRVALATV
jgi:G:T-mismatch repair DNA endonuclease (very short patch repair protein)